MSEIITALDTYYGRIRLLIGDTEQNDGILPDGRNFLDAELEVFYQIEGEGLTDEVKIIGRAAAAAAEAAAAAWASAPYEETMGPHRVKMRGVSHWQERARELRQMYGNARAPLAFQAQAVISRVIDE